MTKFNPLVSIIIPVYNGSNYLKEAIDSALAQTYKNIEVIVVNDGSNDNGATEKIAKSYGNKIRYFKKKNGGVATALNLGIEKMKGDYFSWLSHDDLYYPNKIERQINFLRRLDDKNVFLYSNYSILRGKRLSQARHHHEMLVRKPRYALLRGCVNGITILISKKILDDIGQFDSSLRCTQDYDYWHRIQDKYPLIHMEDVLAVTRLHPSQDSVVSPHVTLEGDKLWIRLIKAMPDKEKIEYEGTLYNFYFELTKFLKTTIYNGALKYSQKRLAMLEKNDQELLKSKPKVSVIIPFYNRLSKTSNAVKSVLNQTYKNIEILLIDDGSDEDLSALKRLAQQHKNIKIVHLKSNSGPAMARNAGIREASGEYIAFLDSDDEFLEDKIRYQLSMMLKHNPDFSYTSYVKRESGVDQIMNGSEISGIAVPRIITNCSIATPTVMIKRAILVDEGRFFDETIRIGEDVRLWLEIAKKHELLFIKNPLTVVNVGNSSSAYDEEKQIVGLQNILSYVVADPYYSRFVEDVGILCNNFFNATREVVAKRNNALRLVDYQRPEWIEQAEDRIKNKIKSTRFYGIARRAQQKCLREILMPIKSKVNKLRNRSRK